MFNSGPRGGPGDFYITYGAAHPEMREARAWSVPLMPKLERSGDSWEQPQTLYCPAGVITQLDFTPALGLRSPFVLWGQLDPGLEDEIEQELR